MQVMLPMVSRVIRFLMAGTALRAKRVKMGAGSVSRGSIRTTIRVEQGVIAGLAEPKLAAMAATADPLAPGEVPRGALILTFVVGLRHLPACPAERAPRLWMGKSRARGVTGVRA